MKYTDGVKLKIEDVPKKRDALADSIEKDFAKLGELVHTVLTRSQVRVVMPFAMMELPLW